MLFADLLSLHLVTFLMFFILVEEYVQRFSCFDGIVHMVLVVVCTAFIFCMQLLLLILCAWILLV